MTAALFILALLDGIAMMLAFIWKPKPRWVIAALVLIFTCLCIVLYRRL